MTSYEPDDAIAAITGRTVVRGEVTEGGLHFWLDDGRLVIIIGVLAVAEVSASGLH